MGGQPPAPPRLYTPGDLEALLRARPLASSSRPAALYVSRDDHLLIRAHNSLASVTVAVRGRFMQPDGQVTPFVETLVPTTDRLVAVASRAMGEGFLLSLSVTVEGAAPQRGQTFVQVALTRGGGLASDPVALLISDYATANAQLGWPGDQLLASVEGPGLLRSVGGTDPGAGAEISETVPTNARWRLISLRAQLVTSAAVANRRVHVVIDDGSTIMFDAASGTDQTASLTHSYSAFAGSPPASAQDSAHTLPLPATLQLLQGWRIRTVTSLLQAGDNWGAPRLLVEELIED